MCESKGSYPEHGQGGCPAPPILASSSTIRRCGQSTAHSWIRSWTGKDEIGHRHVTIYCTGRLYTSYDTYWTCTTRTTSSFHIVWSFVPTDLPGFRQHMARWQPTFVVERDPVQEMVERLETSSTQTRHVGKAVGESQWMVAKPTWWCIQNHPESQCCYGHWSLQTQRCNYWWHCPQGHDGGAIDALLTSCVFENTRLKSSRNHTNSGRGTFLYSCSGFVGSFHIVPLCWSLFCFSDDPNSIDGPVCSFTSTCQFEASGLVERHSDAAYFLLHVVGRPTRRPPMFQTPSSGVRAFQPYCQFPTKVLCGFHFFLCFGPRTFTLSEISASATEQIRVGWSCLTVLVQIWQFLDVVCFPDLHQQIQLLGFGASLNSTVATPIEYSVHLPVFQLPKGTHFANQIFQFTAVWSIFFVAKTPLAIYTSTSPTSTSQSSLPPTSTTMGNHPGFGQQLNPTLSHGKTTPLQWNWRPRMLLHPTPGQQPWRTSTFVCNQCHRPSFDILESQESSKTCSSPSTLVDGPQLDSWSSTATHHSRPRHQMLQNYLTDSIYRDCIYEVPVGHGQFVQPQRRSCEVGWRRGPKMCLWSPTTTYQPSPPTWWTLGYWWRQPTLRRCPFYIHCYGLASKQNFPTIQRNPYISAPGFAVMDYQKLTPFITKNIPWCTLATIHSLPLHGPP